MNPVFVTGGGGFLGLAVCKALLKHGHPVRSFSRQFYPELAKLGVEQRQGDLRDLASLTEAMTGCSAVIHTAAKAGIWGHSEDFYGINVLGTQNVLAAAESTGVQKLVYTSSPSVVFAGKDIEGTDESIPYAKEFLCPYPHTKRLAEEAVLQTNGKQGLATVALRPHLIWGPGDPHFLPRLRENAQKGKIRRVGSQHNQVDVIYVDNAADAHVAALEHLSQQSPLAGQAYFIGQEKPVKLWGFVQDLLKHTSLPPLPPGKVPFPVAYGLGSLLEGYYAKRGLYDREPPMTRFLACQLAKSHYFSHARAQRDFGYHPKVSLEEGLKRLH